MTVLVGYLPTPEGKAAFSAALDEAARRREDLVVLSSPGRAPSSARNCPRQSKSTRSKPAHNRQAYP
ncbi:UNVERIFIED_CONTAM: hypothetical protein RKD50_009311 [Streptomyces canus]